MKDLFVEQVSEEAADVLNDNPPEGSELGVITLGVNEVKSYCCSVFEWEWTCRTAPLTASYSD